jgi:hypothetical protein
MYNHYFILSLSMFWDTVKAMIGKGSLIITWDKTRGIEDPLHSSQPR